MAVAHSDEYNTEIPKSATNRAMPVTGLIDFMFSRGSETCSLWRDRAIAFARSQYQKREPLLAVKLNQNSLIVYKKMFDES